jgi:hypothetical protein
VKTILAVSYYLPPLLYPQSIQIGRLIEGLKRQFNMVLVTADQRGGPRDDSLAPGLFDGVEDVIRIPRTDNLYLNYAKNNWLPLLYQRPDIYRAWMRTAFRAIDRAASRHRFDAIVTFSFPTSTNLLGAWLKDRLGVRWVSHNSDPWADNPLSRISRWTRTSHRRMERDSFAKADALLFPSDEMSAMYRQRYPDLAARVHTLNHSFDPAAYPAAVSKSSGIDRPCTLRYIGTFYGGRTPEPLYGALALLNPEDRRRLRIEIIGGGRSAWSLRERYGLTDSVVIQPGVSYRESLRLMADSDVLLVIDAPSTEASVFFPSKLADYIGAKRSILGISPPGTTRRILDDLGQPCHQPGDTQAIAKSLRAMVHGPSANAPDFSEQELAPYTLDKNVQRLAELIER